MSLNVKIFRDKVIQVEGSVYVPPVSLLYFLTRLSLNTKEKMELQLDADMFLPCPSSGALVEFHRYTHYNQINAHLEALEWVTR